MFYDLTVPDFTKEKFNMSGVVLTAATAQVTPTAEADPVLKAALPGPPTTRREFYPIDVLALYAEVYDRCWTDVPHTVDVTTRLVDEQGKEVSRTADARKSSEFQSASTKSGFFGYNAQVPLAEVKPGRYMLQVEAKARLKDAPAVRARDADHDRAAAARPGEAVPAKPRCRWRRRPLRPTPSRCWGCRRGPRRPWRWGGAWVTGALVCWLAPDGARFVRHHARHVLWVTGGVTALAVGLWIDPDDLLSCRGHAALSLLALAA